MKHKGLIALSLLVLSLILSCKNPKGELPASAKISPNKYSSLFILASNNTDSFLLLRNPKDSGHLIGKFFWGKSEAYEGFVKIKTRDRLVAMSAVFTGMIEALNRQDQLQAVDEGRFITSPRTVRRIEAGQITSVAVNGKLDNEKLVALKPGIIFTYYVDPGTKASYQRIEQMGIPVLFCQNYLENHPLARAEWIRVFGWLLNNASKAEEMFNEIETHYNDLKSKAETLTPKPMVLINAPFSGVWDAPSGESFMAVLIHDAGANYLWSDIKGIGRKAISVEEAYKKARNADIWINPGAIETLDELKKADTRFIAIKAVKDHKVYNATRLKNKTFGNAYWEYGVLRPDIVLKDLVALFHPEYPIEHSIVFFEPLRF